jgi:hypothetical protein
MNVLWQSLSRVVYDGGLLQDVRDEAVIYAWSVICSLPSSDQYYSSCTTVLMKDGNGACHRPSTRTNISTWIYNVFPHHTAARVWNSTELGGQLRCPKASSVK